MNRAAMVALAVVALIIGFLGWSYLYSGEINFYGAVAGQAQTITWWGLLGGYIATIVGVFVGAGYRAIAGAEVPTGQISDLSETLRQIFRSRDLWAGLFASPLVFGVIFKTADGISLSGLVVIALENGFFCHFIVQQFSKTHAASPQPE